MTIYNLHGYHGSAQNAAYAAWIARGAEVISHPIDYDTLTPGPLLQRLEADIAANRPDCICGTSLGGFFAAVLAVRTGLPVYLINPCMLPFLHLPRLGFTGDIRPFIALFGEIHALRADRARAIVGGSDELIDTHDFTQHLLGSARVTVIPEGKHSGATLPLFDFFGEPV